MTTYLLHDDAMHSPELRHEIGEAIVDPITFIEHDGKRIVVGGTLEEPILSIREDVVDEFWNDHDLGSDALIRDESFPMSLTRAELVRRALERVGVSSVVVPPSFHVAVADHLRSSGIEVLVDPDAWLARRRRKTPWELEGIERAQRAAETAYVSAAHMLRESEPTATGQLRFEGEILTAEWIREVMTTELLAQGASSDEILIQTGDSCLDLHDLGTGPILPDASCIIDCFPMDRRTGAFTDMTRTFVPGTPSEDLDRLHSHCRAALDIALANARDGASDLYDKVAGYFEDQGFPTQRSHAGDRPLRRGFCHGLGHGVGLEVHERPWMGRRSEPLLEGDVVAIEPGLYFEDVGGVRLEDTILITDGGFQHFTDPYSYELTP